MSEITRKTEGTPETVWKFDSEFSKEWFLGTFWPAINPMWDAFAPGTEFSVEVPQVYGEMQYMETVKFTFVGWIIPSAAVFVFDDIDLLHHAMA